MDPVGDEVLDVEAIRADDLLSGDELEHVVPGALGHPDVEGERGRPARVGAQRARTHLATRRIAVPRDQVQPRGIFSSRSRTMTTPFTVSPGR
jgi:hypothetical protein